MGMFDWVEFECPCPDCGETLTDFQTKDMMCGLDRLKPWEVNRFYAMCDKCDRWVEFRRKDGSTETKREPPPEPPNWRDDFELY